MKRHDVCIELDSRGECMAHVLDLPGCFVRADSQEKALAALPEAVRSYYAWLQEHGEGISELGDSITLQVAEISTGFGPFRRGDKATLFAPDRAPASRDDMELYLRRASYARADLLALVRDLPDAMLDWKTDPQAMSIREILRHIGNAEEWYVSRLVDPKTLPAEWAHDESLPIAEFLEMERRTAFERLRRLTDWELAQVSYPNQWTDHPEEPWTARKALRRLLEHEREHISQIRQVVATARKAWERTSSAAS